MKSRHKPKPNVTCIIGGQYGSEGKGAICGYLGNEFDIAVRVGAPNAGHTLKVGNNEWKMQQIPVAGLINPDCVLLIGAGGLINLEILKREMEYIKDLDGRFFIDRNCGIIEDYFSEIEQEDKKFESIGSTCEGVGVAMRRKIDRKPQNFRTAKDVPELGKYIINVAEYLNDLPSSKNIMIEGTQGHGLSLNHGPWPFCTSRDIIASSLLSDVGLSPFMCKDIIMVVRTYPIRVAGNSGPMYDEITWKIVAEECSSKEPIQEKTTVTKRVRRVGRFSMKDIINAVKINRPTQIALTFLDYLNVAERGVSNFALLKNDTKKFIYELSQATGVPVTLLKTGPEFEDICDNRRQFGLHK